MASKVDFRSSNSRLNTGQTGSLCRALGQETLLTLGTLPLLTLEYKFMCQQTASTTYITCNLHS